MGLALPYPDHTTLSRRNATGEVSPLDNRGSQGPVDLIVDSTGTRALYRRWHVQSRAGLPRSGSIEPLALPPD